MARSRNLLPCEHKNDFYFYFYFCWLACSWQQYKPVECCHGLARQGAVCTLVTLQNVSYCCQQYTRIVRYSCKMSDFNQICNFPTHFLMFPNIIFNENTSNGSRAHTCEQTDGRTRRSWQAFFTTYAAALKMNNICWIRAEPRTKIRRVFLL